MSALQQYIYKRCEEILRNDEISQEYNKRILELEKQFKSKLTPELIKEYNKLEELIIEASTYNEFLIYIKSSKIIDLC